MASPPRHDHNSILSIGFSVCLVKITFVNLFYYLAYFLYYSWVSLHFLVLFMDPTVLFQLIFIFIYNTFNKKFLVSVSHDYPSAT